MGYQHRIFGAGMHKGIEIGQQMERNRIAAAVRTAQEQAQARSRQNLIDGAATFTGTVIGELLMLAWDKRKEQRRISADTSAV